jgi:small GTP-binding protein
MLFFNKCLKLTNNDSIYINPKMKTYKLMLIGDEKVGKTSIITKYIENWFNTSYYPTFGVDFKIKIIKNNIKLCIFDSSGNSKYYFLNEDHYKYINVPIFMYDITNSNSFNNMKNWINKFKRINPFTKIIIIGNKNDLELRQISFEKGHNFAKQQNGIFIELSIKNDNFSNLLNDIILFNF